MLDVVYNHLGRMENYVMEFSKDYVSDRYENEWGDPLNFDGRTANQSASSSYRMPATGSKNFTSMVFGWMQRSKSSTAQTKHNRND
jgi:hypothetical protein